MRILVTGSRTWRDIDIVVDALSQYDPATTTIVHGGAEGLDKIADAVGKAMGFTVEAYPADWSRHDKREGKYRNSQMLYEGKPDEVLGFRAKLNSKGTNDMLYKAGMAGLPCKIYDKFDQ